jgi:predicted metal-dependent HD superfamily phosphohydrolase
VNRGDGTYAELAQLSGLASSDWTWSTIFLDVDLDGYEDLLMTTGHHYDVQDTDTLREFSRIREPDSIANRVKNLQKFPRLETPKLAFRNQHDLTFVEIGAEWAWPTASRLFEPAASLRAPNC